MSAKQGPRGTTEAVTRSRAIGRESRGMKVEDRTFELENRLLDLRETTAVDLTTTSTPAVHWWTFAPVVGW